MDTIWEYVQLVKEEGGMDIVWGERAHFTVGKNEKGRYHHQIALCGIDTDVDGDVCNFVILWFGIGNTLYFCY